MINNFIRCHKPKFLELYFNKQSRVKNKTRVVNVNGDEPVVFPFSIKTSKFSGSCNNINYPCAKICVPDVVKKLNVKVFNLMSRINETRHIECKELIDKGVCDKGFIWNPSNCECECDKACDVGEYLDYENCKCRKKLVAPLIEECTETVEEVKLAKITLAENENSYKCSSCTVYIVLMIVVFIICTGISSYLVYYNWSLVKNNVSHLLSLARVLRQRFNKLINGKSQTN